MQIRTHRSLGFTLVEIMIVVAVIGLLASIAIPSMTRARFKAQQRVCIANLRAIDAAKDQWAMETRRRTGDRARRSAINQYIKGGLTPKCPAEGIYRYGPVAFPPSCNIPDHALIVDFIDAGDPDAE
jgi:prepilin-type N-terminal cleavage/methylation domain-containing protein